MTVQIVVTDDSHGVSTHTLNLSPEERTALIDLAHSEVKQQAHALSGIVAAAIKNLVK